MKFAHGRVIKFAIIGIAATVLHVLLVSLILSYGWLSAAESNALAFALATTFSYFMNTYWSFEQKVNSKNAKRFTSISLIGCGLTYSIALLIDNSGYHYLIGIAVVVSVVPIFTYIMHSLWTYKV